MLAALCVVYTQQVVHNVAVSTRRRVAVSVATARSGRRRTSASAATLRRKRTRRKLGRSCRAHKDARYTLIAESSPPVRPLPKIP